MSNVIKDLALHDSTEEITTLIKKLSEMSKSSKHEHCAPLLNKFKSELDKDMARRVFAGKNGAYAVLINVINACKDEPLLLRAALKTINSLMTGNPDLLDESGISLQKRFKYIHICFNLLRNRIDSIQFILFYLLQFIRM